MLPLKDYIADKTKHGATMDTDPAAPSGVNDLVCGLRQVGKLPLTTVGMFYRTPWMLTKELHPELFTVQVLRREETHR